ncbi:hypothetical protein MARINON1_52629 [Marinobacter salarius]|nr:hypothetical protein MBHK15_110117 [Marinobacter salarius]VXC30156.1 hypothetical protein MARINON1_52629 [Marinobacter salarius]
MTGRRLVAVNPGELVILRYLMNLFNASDARGTDAAEHAEKAQSTVPETGGKEDWGRAFRHSCTRSSLSRGKGCCRRSQRLAPIVAVLLDGAAG